VDSLILFTLHSIDEYDKLKDSPSRLHFPLCIVFISFLSPTSLELCAELIRSDRFQDYILAHRRGSYHLPLAIVYFPIARQPEINNNLLIELDTLMFERTTENRRQRINRLTAFAGQQVTAAMTQCFTHPDTRHIDAVQMNQVLFGPVAAHYLQTVFEFPVVTIGETTYNGIPNGMTISQFMAFLFGA
jgi:hypothetical protein